MPIRQSLKILQLMGGAAVLMLAQQTHAAGIWIDEHGRSTQMGAPGMTSFNPSANGHDLKNAVSLFHTLCVSSFTSKDAVGKAAEGTDWGFSYQVDEVPFKDPVDLGGWISRDALLNVSDGIFLNPNPQCNLLVNTTDDFDIALIERAVSEQIGAAPRNADKAVKKNGKPNKHYSPEWGVKTADGLDAIIYARRSVANANVVHLALMKKQEKK